MLIVNPQTQAMKGEFKWITGEFGPARELDVFITRVVKPVADDKPNGSGVAVLAKDLRQRRDEAFSRAQAAVESTRFRGLMLDAAAWIEVGDWTRNSDNLTRLLREQPIAAAAAEELRRRWKKTFEKGRAARPARPATST